MPPKSARRLLSALLGESERDDVLTNLDDLHRDRTYRRGPFRAALWYWWQALSLPVRLWMNRLDPTPTHSRNGIVGAPMSTILDDLRGALRTLRRAPGYALAVILTLALGFGANTTIFAVVNSTVLKPLPLEDPEHLMWVWPSGQIPLTLEQFDELAPATTDLARVSALTFRSYVVLGGDRPQQVSGVAVSPNHLSVLGVDPVLGRDLQPQDAAAGSESVAVISHELWETTFGADPGVVGQRVELLNSANTPMTRGAFSGSRFTIVGVLPEGFDPMGFHLSVYTPLVSDPEDPSYRDLGEISVVARLEEGVTPDLLQAGLVRLSGELPHFQELEEAIAGDEVLDLREAIYGSMDGPMWITLSAVVLVLLIACANVMNLSLVHSQRRRRELSIRHAIGANRSRLLRRLLLENVVLSTVATAMGFGVAALTLPIAESWIPTGLFDTEGIALDGLVVVFAVGCLLATALLSGIVPARFATRDLVPGRSSSSGAGFRRVRSSRLFRNSLIVAELALALVLVQGAGLLLKSFRHLVDTDPGFESANVMTVQVAPTSAQYQDPAVRRSVFDEILARVGSQPGVESAAAIHFLPIADGGPSIFYRTDPNDTETRRSVAYRVVTPGYFETMGITLLEGRDLSYNDRDGTAPAGLVNESLAAELWPGESAIGKTIYRTNGAVLMNIVGVVGDVRQTSVGLPPRSEMYLPLAQSAWSSTMTMVVRGSTPSVARIPFEALVHEVDPNLPVPRIASMESLLNSSLANARSYGILFGSFALLAVVLGAVGVYGIISSIVGERTSEIGIRIALGASSRRVLNRELWRGSKVIGVGIAVGIAISIATTGVLETLLYEVSTTDPSVIAGTSLILGTVAWIAVMFPALRASRIDPMRAIRIER